MTQVPAKFERGGPVVGKVDPELVDGGFGGGGSGLGTKHGFGMPTAVVREWGQFVIGSRVPEEMRETARDGEVGIGSVFSRHGEVVYRNCLALPILAHTPGVAKLPGCQEGLGVTLELAIEAHGLDFVPMLNVTRFMFHVRTLMAPKPSLYASRGTG